MTNLDSILKSREITSSTKVPLVKAMVFPMSVQDFSRDQWFDLFAVQGTLKSLLQHHSSKPSILWCSAFFMVQLSQSYMTTGKAIALYEHLLAK